MKRTLIILTVGLLSLSPAAFAAPTLTGGTANAAPGDTVNLPINFNPSPATVVGVQFQLTLPAGMSAGTPVAGTILGPSAGNKVIAKNGTVGVSTYVVVGLFDQLPASGACSGSVHCGNTNSIATGKLMDVPVTIPAGTPGNNYLAQISNISFVDAGGLAVAGTATPVTISVTVPGTVATPTFNPPAGNFISTVDVTIQSATSGAVIYYTLDGSNPTLTSAVYSGPITLNATTTVKAMATATGMTQSVVASAVYTRIVPTVATPTFNPPAGNFTTSVSVTIQSATSGAVIYYTLDGSNPTLTSAVYSGPITLNATTTVKAMAAASGMTNSAIATAVYTKIIPTVATPTFNPPAGNFTTSVSVSIQSATSGAVIYYTLDGSNPTLTSTVYSGPIMLNVTTTVKAMAAASGMTNSAVATAVYTNTTLPVITLPDPTLSLPSYVKVNGSLVAGYPAGYTNLSFRWTLDKVSDNMLGSPSASQAIISKASSANFPSSSNVAPLAPQGLVPGTYRVTVQAVDANGNTSNVVVGRVSLVQADLSAIRVYPNPWRSDRHENNPFVTFDSLTVNTTIKIFTISGHHVKTLPASSSAVRWDLTNNSGDKVASGSYVYLITTDDDQKKTGQIVVIK